MLKFIVALGSHAIRAQHWHVLSFKVSLQVAACSVILFVYVLAFSDVPVESLRLRFALLQSLNNTLESFFLPLVELRQTQTYQNSIAALLCEAKGEQGLISLEKSR